MQTENLLAAPGAVDVGMIRNTGNLPLDWVGSDARPHHRTVLDPVDYKANRHLWDQHVIDAAGVNLLTSRHLQHATNLQDDWTNE